MSHRLCHRKALTSPGGQRVRDCEVNDRRTPRIYVEARLVPSAEIELQRAHAHYLGSVLRLALGAEVAVFNGIDGEWLCRVTEIGRAGARLRAIRHTRPPEAEDALDPWLLFAPIKRARLDWLIEKATELGVAAFLPVWTRRTQVERINLDRLRAHAIEAAEQSERLTVPELRAPEPLDRMLSAWPRERRLVICDENGGEPIAGAAARLPSRKLALLVGPEG